MHARTLSWIGAGMVGAAFGGALCLSHLRSAGLRREVEALQHQAGEVHKLEHERDRLRAAQPDSEGLASLRADRVALERVRTELSALQSAVARLPSARTGEPAMMPAAQWTNAGRATPAATVETVLWSGRSGEVDQLASLLTFDEPVLARAKALFDRLPAEARLRHGSAERLVALLTARDATYEAMQIAAMTPVSDTNLKRLQEVQPEVTGMVVMQARVQRPGQSPGIKTLVLRQKSDGWRLVVPAAAIESYALQFASTTP
ncbi:MAG TPA: hypothetical protein VGD88_01380 [Opitutaceae bacterium]